MPIHSVVVVERSSETLLFSKYFDESIISKKNAHILFESQLYNHSKYYWDAAGQGKQACYVDNVIVVLESLGELIIYVCGTDEADEAILARLLNVLKNVVIDILDTKGTVTKESFMNAENYGKFCVSVDDTVAEGIIESYDVNTISKFSKLRN